MNERRALQRFELKFPVRITPEENGREKIVLNTFNICSQGAFIGADKPFSVGTHLELEIFILSLSGGKDDIIWTRGEVVRTEPAGMAVQFDANYQILPIEYAAEQ